MIYTDCKVGQLITLNHGDEYAKMNNVDSTTWTILCECGVYKIIRLSNPADGRVKISCLADPAKMLFARPTSIKLFRLDISNVDDDCVYDSSKDNTDEENESNVRDESGKVDTQKLANEMKVCVSKMEETRARWRKEREERLDKKSDIVKVKIMFDIRLPEQHKTLDEIADFIEDAVRDHLLDRNCENFHYAITKLVERCE